MTLGQPHRHFAHVDSTNRAALEWSDAPHGALVTADAQTHGRGRLGRAWSSPPGRGLYLSLILRDVEVDALSLRVGLGIARALENAAPLRIALKWPNDVLCRGCKIGGVLCESRGALTVVGIGLNVSHQSHELPARPLFPASSLRLLGAPALSASEILPPLLEHLERALDDPNWRDGVESRLFGRGEVVRIGAIVGLLRGVDASGALQVQTANALETVVAGDMEWI